MTDLLARATRFVWSTARVLEQRRFGHLFGEPDPDGVLAALNAYATADGGYGYALEPDGRGPSSQPLHVDFALRVLAEIDRATPDTLRRICDYLRSITRADGGVPSVHVGIRDYPRPPWWAIDEGDTSSLLPTASLAGLLHSLGADDPWLADATEFCWARIEALTDTHPYEVHNCLAFLDRVPDRARADRAAKRLGELVRDGDLVLLDPDHPEGHSVAPGYAAGEFHLVHDYAPRPESLARAWFSAAEMDHGLDFLARDQREDGGWAVRWPMWTPAVEPEWRGVATVQALVTLRDYGRL